MDEESVPKAPVTRLTRRLSVELTDDVNSPSAPSTPTKKRSTRLAAKPLLDNIDENATIASPLRVTRRRSTARDLAEGPEEKALTPSRRSTRIKSNTSITSETIQNFDSPRAKRAARRTSLAGSDTEGPQTPVRQTRRTRKDSASSVENFGEAGSKATNQILAETIKEEQETQDTASPKSGASVSPYSKKKNSKTPSPSSNKSGNEPNEIQEKKRVLRARKPVVQPEPPVKKTKKEVKEKPADKPEPKKRIRKAKSWTAYPEEVKSKIKTYGNKNFTHRKDGTVSDDSFIENIKSKSAEGETVTEILMKEKYNIDSIRKENSSEKIDSKKEDTNPKFDLEPINLDIYNKDKEDNKDKQSEDNIPDVHQLSSTSEIKVQVYIEDTDSNSDVKSQEVKSDKEFSEQCLDSCSNKSPECTDINLDLGDQCVPDVHPQDIENVQSDKSTDDVHDNSKVNQSKDEILPANDVEPMDVDETIPEDIIISDINTNENENRSSRGLLINGDQSMKVSKNKSSIVQDLENSSNANKSTLILSQIKDDISVTAKPSPGLEGNKTNVSKINGSKEYNTDKNQERAFEETKTPIKNKKMQLLGMQTSTPVTVSNTSETSVSLDSSSDDEQVSCHKNSLVASEAEDAGEDYESGDSQDEEERQYEKENEIFERGDTLTSDDEISNDTDYERDSFLVSSDAEDYELLSGSGDDLSMSDNVLTMSAKSKNKYNERKLKEQKQASREMYESRHKKKKPGRISDDSDSNDESITKTSKKNKSNRQRLDSSVFTSGDESVKMVRKNRMRLNSSTNKSTNETLDISEKDESNNVNMTEKEITVINESVLQVDPLSNKSHNKSIDLNNSKNINMTENEMTVVVNESVLDKKDPLLQASDSDSENEEIKLNYEAVQKGLNDRNNSKSHNNSLNLAKKKSQNESIIDLLNLSETSSNNKANKNSTVKKRSYVETHGDSSSDSVDLKLLFPDVGSDVDCNTQMENDKSSIKSSDDFIPLNISNVSSKRIDDEFLMKNVTPQSKKIDLSRIFNISGSTDKPASLDVKNNSDQTKENRKGGPDVISIDSRDAKTAEKKPLPIFLEDLQNVSESDLEMEPFKGFAYSIQGHSKSNDESITKKNKLSISPIKCVNNLENNEAQEKRKSLNQMMEESAKTFLNSGYTNKKDLNKSTELVQQPDLDDSINKGQLNGSLDFISTKKINRKSSDRKMSFGEATETPKLNKELSNVSLTNTSLNKSSIEVNENNTSAYHAMVEPANNSLSTGSHSISKKNKNKSLSQSVTAELSEKETSIQETAEVATNIILGKKKRNKLSTSSMSEVEKEISNSINNEEASNVSMNIEGSKKKKNNLSVSLSKEEYFETNNDPILLNKKKRNNLSISSKTDVEKEIPDSHMMDTDELTNISMNLGSSKKKKKNKVSESLVGDLNEKDMSVHLITDEPTNNSVIFEKKKRNRLSNSSISEFEKELSKSFTNQEYNNVSVNISSSKKKECNISESLIGESGQKDTSAFFNTEEPNNDSIILKKKKKNKSSISSVSEVEAEISDKLNEDPSEIPTSLGSSKKKKNNKLSESLVGDLNEKDTSVHLIAGEPTNNSVIFEKKKRNRLSNSSISEFEKELSKAFNNEESSNVSVNIGSSKKKKKNISESSVGELNENESLVYVIVEDSSNGCNDSFGKKKRNKLSSLSEVEKDILESLSNKEKKTKTEEFLNDQDDATVSIHLGKKRKSKLSNGSNNETSVLLDEEPANVSVNPASSGKKKNKSTTKFLEGLNGSLEFNNEEITIVSEEQNSTGSAKKKNRESRHSEINVSSECNEEQIATVDSDVATKKKKQKKKTLSHSGPDSIQPVEEQSSVQVEIVSDDKETKKEKKQKKEKSVTIVSEEQNSTGSAKKKNRESRHSEINASAECNEEQISTVDSDVATKKNKKKKKTLSPSGPDVKQLVEEPSSVQVEIVSDDKETKNKNKKEKSVTIVSEEQIATVDSDVATRKKKTLSPLGPDSIQPVEEPSSVQVEIVSDDKETKKKKKHKKEKSEHSDVPLEDGSEKAMKRKRYSSVDKEEVSAFSVYQADAGRQKNKKIKVSSADVVTEIKQFEETGKAQEVAEDNKDNAQEAQVKTKKKKKSRENLNVNEHDKQENAKKTLKRKERQDDDVPTIWSKVQKENSIDGIHVARLPSSLLEKLEKQKPHAGKKKASLVSTSSFIVEEVIKRKNHPSQYLEDSIHLNSDSPDKKKLKKNIVKPKVLPFTPSISISDSGFITSFKVNVIPSETKFVAQATSSETNNFKDDYFKKKIKKLGTYETYKKQRNVKLSKF